MPAVGRLWPSDDDDNVDCVASSTGNMRMCGFDVDDVENLILLSPRIRSTVPHHLHPITTQPLPSFQVCSALMLDFDDLFAFFNCATVGFSKINLPGRRESALLPVQRRPIPT